MKENKLTLIDAFNQFWIAADDTDGVSINHTGFTYFYLVRIWNAAGRPSLFRRQNNLMCAQLGISYPTLDRHRKALQECGLLDYSSNGRGDPNISYKIQRLAVHRKKTTCQQYESRDGFDVDSPGYPDDAYKQSIKSKEKEFLVVVVSGEKKDFNFFINFFDSDPGIQAGYAAQGLGLENFSGCLEQWMIRNHGKAYPDIQEARRHFLFWLPFYKNQNEKENETRQHTTGGKNPGSSRKTDMDYAEGL